MSRHTYCGPSSIASWATHERIVISRVRRWGAEALEAHAAAACGLCSVSRSSYACETAALHEQVHSVYRDTIGKRGM